MTKAKASAAHVNAQEAKPELPRPDERQDLDAEIVRDLDVDEQADDARGGGWCLFTGCVLTNVPK